MGPHLSRQFLCKESRCGKRQAPISKHNPVGRDLRTCGPQAPVPMRCELWDDGRHDGVGGAAGGRWVLVCMRGSRDHSKFGLRSCQAPAPRDSELCLPLQLPLVINSSSSSSRPAPPNLLGCPPNPAQPFRASFVINPIGASGTSAGS
jgi:hypothetical protein